MLSDYGKWDAKKSGGGWLWWGGTWNVYGWSYTFFFEWKAFISSVMWKVSESESLVFPVFSQRVISRVFGAATCPSVVHTYLCCSSVRKSHGHHCTDYFKTECHGHACNHCLDIIPEPEFLDKVDLEDSHPVIYAHLRCWGWPQFTYAFCLFRGRSLVGWSGIELEVKGDWLCFWASLLSSQT